MITDGCVVRSDSRQRKMVKTSILHINTHEIIRYSSPFVADRVLPSHSIHKKGIHTSSFVRDDQRSLEKYIIVRM